ncbi:hypothetical protein TURU_034467 [Turdus rufiventris]|nr:hypothetical protein TURU_034467 [Turdus rufiventris]
MLLLPLLALAAAWSHGQAQVLLKQREVSITRGHKTRASMDCIAEGIPAFQYAYIHWYRHVPTKAPERVLYIGDGAASYDDNSYRNKYSSSKKGTNVCTLTINDINSSDEDGFAQEIPIQSPISITKFQKSARMTCEIQTLGANFDGIIIHWYKQKEGEAPGRLLFVSGRKVTVESGFDANRYMAEGNFVQKQCILTIKDIIPDDAATYYCAYWDPHCDRNAKIIKTKKTACNI